MTCRMDAEQGEYERIGAMRGDARVVKLRELGITDEGLLQKLRHSGRNGVIRYLKRNSLNSSMQTVVTALPLTPSIVTGQPTSSGQTRSMTPIIPESACNHMASTNTWAQPCIPTIECPVHQLRCTLDQKTHLRQ